MFERKKCFITYFINCVEEFNNYSDFEKRLIIDTTLLRIYILN